MAAYSIFPLSNNGVPARKVPRRIYASGPSQVLDQLVPGVPDWSDFEKRHMDKLALALHSAKVSLLGGTDILPDFTSEAIIEQREIAWRACVGEIAKVLRDDNRAFKENKFVDACVGGCKPPKTRTRRTKR